jgi:site-specific DNA-methyltransferase (adenine-specific)
VKPYYEQSGVTIYHGDAREVADLWRGQRSHSFGLTLTDPPYGHGDKWSGGTWASDPMYADAKLWDAETIPDGDLIELLTFAPFAVVWGGNYYRMPPSRSWLAWVKSSQMQTMADFELAWTNFDKPSKMLREDRNPDGKRWHPTQKPESVMRWAIRQTPETVRSVFDPFMGSGTSLVAAKRLGIPSVGIDVSEAYCEIAAQRLQQEVLPFSA